MIIIEKDEGEYELIPISPIRRLEKRIEELEKSKFDTKEFYKELVDIIRINQEVVQEIAKSSDALRIELSKLPGRLEALTIKLDELISFIRASATEEEVVTQTEGTNLSSKLDQLIETNKKIAEGNQAIINALESLEKKLRKPIPPISLRRPIMPTRPI